jgi:hypothetical protein
MFQKYENDIGIAMSTPMAKSNSELLKNSKIVGG